MCEANLTFNDEFNISDFCKLMSMNSPTELNLRTREDFNLILRPESVEAVIKMIYGFSPNEVDNLLIFFESIGSFYSVIDYLLLDHSFDNTIKRITYENYNEINTVCFEHLNNLVFRPNKCDCLLCVKHVNKYLSLTLLEYTLNKLGKNYLNKNNQNESNDYATCFD
jgi:hypothetical protein